MTNAKKLTKKMLSMLLVLCMVVPLFSSAFSPLAAELKDALTVESSAASTTDISTINYRSGGYHYYYHQSGATFVSSVYVVSKSQWSTTNLANKVKDAGYYYPNDEDLNDGAGGYYIKFGFGMSTDPKVAYTKMAISSNETANIDSTTSWPAYYRFSLSGKTYNVTWEKSSTNDLNEDAGGAYLYFCNTHDTRVGKPLTFIYAVNGGDSSSANGNYARYLNNSSVADLNQSAGGDYIHLAQEDGAQSNRACHDNHKYVNTTGTTDVSDELEELQMTYNQYNDYYVSGRYTTASYNALGTALNNALNCINDYSDYYSSSYTAATMSSYQQAIIDAAENLAINVYYDATTNGGTTSKTSDTMIVGIDDSGAYQFITTNTASKDGWAYSGWSTDKNAITGGSSVIVGYNSTIYAIFSRRVNFQFSYYTRTGSPTQRIIPLIFYNAQTTGEITSAAGVDNIKRYGGTFTILGFRDDKDAVNVPEVALSTAYTLNEADLAESTYIYYAIYERHDHTLAFDANKGENAPAALTATQYLNAGGTITENTFTIPNKIPTRNGYTFQGWSETKAGAVAYQPGDTVTLDVDMTLYAIWGPTDYTITFDTDGGDELEAKTYTYESTEKLNERPTKQGYTFNNTWIVTEAEGTWTKDAVIEYGTALRRNIGNVTLKAQWTPNTDTPYTVYHMKQTADGTDYEAHLIETFKGTTASEITAADFAKTLTGFTYSEAKVDDTVVTTAEIAADGSLVVYLYYNRNSYNVTLNTAEHITEVSGAGSYLHGSEATVSAICPPGYAVEGWYDADGNLVSSSTTYTFIVNDNVTLTPKAQELHYTVTFNDGRTLEYSFGEVGFSLGADEKAGYTFAGWKFTVDGDRINNWTTVFTDGVIDADEPFASELLYGDVSVEPVWTANEYSVTFDVDGGEAIDAITYTIESTDEIPTPEKTGYEGVAWTVKEADEDGNWTVGADVALGSSLSGKYGNVVLKAEYNSVSYTLSFNAASGIVSPAFMIYNTAGDVQRPSGVDGVLPTPTRPGYTFNGWLCTEIGEDSNWVVNEKYAAGLSLVGKTGLAKFTATWTANAYDLSVTDSKAVFNGVTGANVATAGTDYTATLSAANGYKLFNKISVKIGGKEAANKKDFTYTSTDGFKTATLTIKGASIAGDIVVTPIVNVVDYTITYNQVLSNNAFPTTYNIESDAIVIDAPTRPGYAFVGWTGDGIDEAVETITIAAGSTGDKTYTANWEKIYTLRFDTSGAGYIAPVKYKAGDELVISEVSKEGAKFLYWTASGAWTDEVVNPGTLTNRTGDATLTAVFAYATSYKVEEYFMDTEGNYGTPNTTVIDNIFAGTEVTAEFNTYEGFTADAENSILTGTVLDEGALALKLYYTRNQYEVKVEADEGIASVEGAGTHYYGAAVSLKAIPNPGYSVKGWTGDYESDEAVLEFTLGLADVNVKVTSENNNYTVGFAVDVEGIEAPAEIAYVRGDSVTLPEIEKAGYDMYWCLSVDEGTWTAGNIAPGTYDNMYGSVVLTAVWVACDDTAYTVKEYFQNIENEEYAEPVIKTKNGTTDTVVAVPDAYDGFKMPLASALTINGAGDTVVEYYYVRNTYTVTYKIADKKEVVEYKYQQAIVPHADVVMTGYRFDGWDASFAETMPAEDLVYTADLEKLVYTVSFYNVIGEAVAAINYTITDDIILPHGVTPGYSINWNLETASGNWTAGEYAPGQIDAGKYGDVRFKADNIPTNAKYTVTYVFEQNNGTLNTGYRKEKTGITGELVAAPENVDGYVTPMASKKLIKGDGTTAVTYIYYLDSYTIAYEIFDEVTTKAYKFGAEVEAFADPSFNGYTFKGWVDEEGNAATIVTTMPSKHLTYKAQFEVIKYDVTFDVDGGSAVENINYDITETVTLPEPTKENYSFVGWQVATATGNWKLDDVVDGVFSGKYGDVSLKALWTNLTADYTVETYFMDIEGNYGEATTETFNGYVADDAIYEMTAVEGFAADADKCVLSAKIAADGSTTLKAYYARNKYTVSTAVSSDDKATITGAGEYYFGAPVTIDVTVADHYTVAVWNGIEASGTSASFTMPMENVSVTVGIAPVVYTFTVDGVASDYTIEDEIEIPAVTNGAFVFDGWILTADAESNWTQDEIVTGKKLTGKYGNVSIVSQWTEIKYTFAYDVNGGEMPTTNYTPAGEYTVSTIIVLPTPTKDGYSFAGWDVIKEDADNCNWEDIVVRNSDNIGSGRYGDVTLKARWTALNVDVYIEHYVQYTYSDEYLMNSKYTTQYESGAELTVDEIVAAFAKEEAGKYHFVKALVNGEEVSGDTTVTVSADKVTSFALYYDLDAHKVTVTYVTPDGVEAPAQYVGEFLYGQKFNVKSPDVYGHAASSIGYSGTMDTEDLAVTIEYTPAAYDITVNYKYSTGKLAKASVTESVTYGDSYSIVSPDLDGYTPSLAVVEGIMGGEDIEVDVIYGLNTHTLTVNYVYADGTVAAEAFVAEFEFGYEYNVKSAVIDGHNASSNYVSGTMPDEDVVLTVTYSPITYTVIFRDFDGTDISVQHIVYGDAATAPADPVRADDENYSYTFKGWSAEFDIITEDIVITAEYISTNLNTGEVSGDEDVDDSFFGKIKAFFERIINFFKVLFAIT